MPTLNELYALSDQIWDLRVARNKLANDLTLEMFREEQPHLFDIGLMQEENHVQDE